MKPRPTRGVLNVRHISPAVKQAFRSACVKRGQMMWEVLEALMRRYAAQPQTIHGWTKEDVAKLDNL